MTQHETVCFLYKRSVVDGYRGVRYPSYDDLLHTQYDSPAGAAIHQTVQNLSATTTNRCHNVLLLSTIIIG